MWYLGIQDYVSIGVSLFNRPLSNRAIFERWFANVAPELIRQPQIEFRSVRDCVEFGTIKLYLVLEFVDIDDFVLAKLVLGDTVELVRSPTGSFVEKLT